MIWLLLLTLMGCDLAQPGEAYKPKPDSEAGYLREYVFINGTK